MLGRLITPAELGCFSLALMIATAPAAGIGQLVNQLFLPLISASIRRSQESAVEDFTKARRAFFAIAVVAGMGFLVFAKPLVAMALTSKYAMTGWMLQALGLRVALDLFTSPASSILLAYGQSRYAAVGNTVRMILMLSGVWIAFVFFGIHFAVLSLVVAQAISYFPLILGLKKVLPAVATMEVRSYLVVLTVLGIGALIFRVGP